MNDPRYYKKHAVNIAPPETYYFLDELKDRVANDKASCNFRSVHSGWNNVTQYEQKGMNELKELVLSKGITTMPPGFEEHDWLKWVQATHYDIEKACDRLLKHVDWLRTVPPEPRLTPLTIRLLQSGCVYLHGRDKCYRPCFVMDGRIMADLAKNQPEMISCEVFNDVFIFLYTYVKKAMLLPGQ